MLFADKRFEDAYWQSSVEDKYTQSYAKDGTWKLREKAEEEHGGGEK